MDEIGRTSKPYSNKEWAPLKREPSWRTSTGPECKQSSKELKIGKDSGRVKVFVRIRPGIKDEEKKTNRLPFELLTENKKIKIPADDRGHPEKTFTFDYVFSPDKTNVEVCEILTEPLMQAATNGFNGTLMAYGQTGSGKTYTLMSESGITRSLIDRCFKHIQHDVKHIYKVSVSYLQIYQEKIFDLLSSQAKQQELAIRENPKTGVYVENMTEYVARSPGEVLQFIATGKKKLIFAETKMNRTSSRSHAVLQMAIERQLNDGATRVDQALDQSGFSTSSTATYSLNLDALGKDVILRGKIHICDLAGSERIKRTGASGDRLSEAQHINSSLLELGNVIAALADENVTHIPFRNSVLTRLLQESLGGNCKTSLVVCVSPANRDLQETKCTLSFGQRAMKVKNVAYVNMEVDFKSLSDQLLKQLNAKDVEIELIRESCKEEVEKSCLHLKRQLEDAKKQHAEEMCEQREEFDEKLHSLSEELENMRNELALKSNEIIKCQESMFSLDDEIENEKRLVGLATDVYKRISFLCSTGQICSCETKMQNLFALAQVFEQLAEHAQTSMNVTELIRHVEDAKNLVLVIGAEEMELLGDVDIWLEKLKEVNGQLGQLFERFSMKFDQADSHSMLLYVVFMKIYIQTCAWFAQYLINDKRISSLTDENKKVSQRLEETNANIDGNLSERDSLQTELLETRKENEKLIDQVKAFQVAKRRSTFSVGVQVKTNDYPGQKSVRVEKSSIKESPYTLHSPYMTRAPLEGSMAQSSTTPALSVKKFLTTTVEDQEKIVTEIETEDIVGSLQDSKAIFSNFGNTLDRIEGLVKLDRQSKYDSSKYTVPSYLRDNDASSRSKSAMDSLDSLSRLTYSYFPSSSPTAYTPPTTDKLYRNNRSSYDNRSSKYSYSRLNEPATDMRKVVNMEMENNGLLNNNKALEFEIEKLRNENREYLNMLQELSHVNVYTNHLTEIKKQIRHKCDRATISTQTDDMEVRRSLDQSKLNQNSPKVAHIKPLLSNSEENRPYSPATSFINLSYDMNENDVVENISSVYELSEVRFNQKMTEVMTWQGQDEPKSYTASIFSRLRNNVNQQQEDISKNRPRTWYGMPNSTSERTYSPTKGFDFSRRDLNVLQEATDEGTIISERIKPTNRWMERKDTGF